MLEEIAMTYTKTKDGEFLENGKSKLKIEEIKRQPSPVTKERTVKIFVIKKVVKSSETNGILSGNLLAISFAPDKVNQSNVVWDKEEECMIPMKIQLDKPRIITK